MARAVFIKTAKAEGVFGDDVDSDDKGAKTTDASERKHCADEDVAEAAWVNEQATALILCFLILTARHLETCKEAKTT